MSARGANHHFWSFCGSHNTAQLSIAVRFRFAYGLYRLESSIKHRAPPINEVGLSVVTSTAGVIDPYDIKGLHDCFGDLPIAERQPTIASMSVASMVGGGSNGFDLSKGHPQKWWFVSTDQSRVLQAQEDFFSYNWRRTGADFGEALDYPGFRKIFSEFSEHKTTLENWHKARETILPSPSGCELYYEDIVPLIRKDGTKFSLSESLSEFNRVEKERLALGWSNGWFESIDGVDERNTSLLKIEINSLGVLDKNTLEQTPVLRFVWTAGAARSTWPDVMEFFGIAHDHVLRRFRALISDEVQTTWE